MMLTSTLMPPATEGKKLVVLKGATEADAAMEVREVDRSTDLLVFDSDGRLQTREGQFFGAVRFPFPFVMAHCFTFSFFFSFSRFF